MMLQPGEEKAKGGLITACKYMMGYHKETPTSYRPGGENRGNCLKSQQVRVSK